MLDSILGASSNGILLTEILLCMVTALVLGVVIAGVYMFRSAYSKNFVVTVALLPAIVGSVILVVNGNLGTGVAVMGAFSLVRFRSVPGTAREIAVIFFAMAAGLACGMGFLLYAALFTVIVGIAMLVYSLSRFGEKDAAQKTLKVLIPEDMDYVHAFDDLFGEYTRTAILERARTTNLGGLYELKYTVQLKDADCEKDLLDKMRQRNGNLSISCGRLIATREEL